MSALEIETIESSDVIILWVQELTLPPTVLITSTAVTLTVNGCGACIYCVTASITSFSLGK